MPPKKSRSKGKKSKTARKKVEAGPDDPDYLLKGGTELNFLAWKGDLILCCGVRYGQLARALEDLDYWVPDEIDSLTS